MSLLHELLPDELAQVEKEVQEAMQLRTAASIRPQTPRDRSDAYDVGWDPVYRKHFFREMDRATTARHPSVSKTSTPTAMRIFSGRPGAGLDASKPEPTCVRPVDAGDDRGTSSVNSSAASLHRRGSSSIGQELSGNV